MTRAREYNEFLSTYPKRVTRVNEFASTPNSSIRNPRFFSITILSEISKCRHLPVHITLLFPPLFVSLILFNHNAPADQNTRPDPLPHLLAQHDAPLAQLRLLRMDLALAHTLILGLVLIIR
jgi:hypothetical protein